MSDFEVCPIGTVARLASVEAELRSMHRCFGVTERARDKYKAERDALLALIASDTFAASFQSLGQYRSALLKGAGGGNG